MLSLTKYLTLIALLLFAVVLLLSSCRPAYVYERNGWTYSKGSKYLHAVSPDGRYVKYKLSR